MWVEIVPVTVSLSWLYSKPWTSNNSFLLRTYTPQQPWFLVAHLCGLSHEPKVQRHSLPTTSPFAQEAEHYLPWALFRFTVHASSSCFSQTKPASFKRSFFFFFFDCFSVDILKCWAKIKQQILTTSETPASNNNRSFCIDHCTGDRKASRSKTAHCSLSSHHAIWDVGQWLQVNCNKRGFKDMFPKPTPSCHCADHHPLHQRRT